MHRANKIGFRKRKKKHPYEAEQERRLQHEIFRKARAVREALEQDGFEVDLSVHPTLINNNSAYLRVKRDDGVCRIERGFRLSNHHVGERRARTDLFPTVIDSPEITVEYLIELVTISDSEFDDWHCRVQARRIVRQIMASKEADAFKGEFGNKQARNPEVGRFHRSLVMSRNAWNEYRYSGFDTMYDEVKDRITRTFNSNYLDAEYRKPDPEFPVGISLSCSGPYIVMIDQERLFGMAGHVDSSFAVFNPDKPTEDSAIRAIGNFIAGHVLFGLPETARTEQNRAEILDAFTIVVAQGPDLDDFPNDPFS